MKVELLLSQVQTPLEHDVLACSRQPSSSSSRSSRSRSFQKHPKERREAGTPLKIANSAEFSNFWTLKKLNARRLIILIILEPGKH